MKKIDVINLIKSHVSSDDENFRRYSLEIASDFANNGDYELSKTIYSMFSNFNLYDVQNSQDTSAFLDRVNLKNIENIYLPDKLNYELIGLFNGLKRNIGFNKFLFYGAPGTGKTEIVKFIAKKLDKILLKVNIAELIDSKLGSTAKNIKKLFREINKLSYKHNIILFFDEIDSLALKRIDSRDVREMGRATTEFFIELDALDKEIVVIAATNLYENLDAAMIRRFNVKINFNKYSQKDLVDIGMKFYKEMFKKINDFDFDEKLFRKILKIYSPLPYPGELKNIIYTSIAFSSLTKKSEYFSRLISLLDCSYLNNDVKSLKNKGFSLREIGKITGTSKSVVDRRLKDD